MPPVDPLGELAGRLHGAGFEPTARELAEALWLAHWVGPGEETGSSDREDGAAATSGAPGPSQHAGRTGHAGTPGTAGPSPGTDKTAPDGNAAVTRLYAEGADPDEPRDAPRDAHAEGTRVRVPEATALPRHTPLQRALSPLRDYRPPVRPASRHLDVQATAERAAETGLLVPVMRTQERHRPRLRLLMDVSNSTVLWETMLDELRRVCATSGAFCEVTVHHLREGGTRGPAREHRRRGWPCARVRRPAA
ncbi:hypothetical protein DTL70_10170 [Streptomyces diacarni]|uniref:Uncharacterized protein n=1 Tax=Streptomyces diacarni TaxID=2800381 RepID=A0A367F4N2_9ACTN|nr:hypothetical protein [Streptomyces diacarni]RCG24705.1 hypothetical protein DTL70_10170 [Streptomyces diacarni]